MIYLYLVLLAATFGVLGFLFHAFCFQVNGDNEAKHKSEALQKELRERQSELKEAREKIVKTTANVRGLEQQVKQRDEETEKLRKTASRQDEAITALQKEAATIRAALAAQKKGPDAPAKVRLPAQAPHAAAATPAQDPKVAPKVEGDKAGQKPPPSPGTAQSGVPAWKENLENIVDILNAMEKDLKK